MKSSLFWVLCERQAATPTPTRPIAISVMPDQRNEVCRVHVTDPLSTQILMLTMRRTIQKPSPIRPAVPMSTISPTPCSIGWR